MTSIKNLLRTNFLLTLFLFSSISNVSLADENYSPLDSPGFFEGLNTFTAVYSQIKQLYVDEIDDETMFNNAIKGHHTAPKKGEFGVLNPTSKLDLENELTNMFQIKYSKTEVNSYITIFEKKAF